ncbi:MAG: RIO1 family regulatory kinase/ATPase [Dehalococcoidia bacterium]
MAATQEALDEALQPFIDEGMISEVVATLKSGKEATAYLCRARPSLGVKYAVAKVHHDRQRRNFDATASYTDGRLILNGQVRRAVAARTEFGLEAEAGIWVDYEFEHLSTLADAGADVPAPFACERTVLLMEFVGKGTSPAPQLQHAELGRADAAPLLERILWNVETFLAAHLVHADLSPFNILVHEGRPWVIDLPQAVDVRFNRNARDLLERDLRNVSKFFTRFGIELDAAREATLLWERYRFAEIG